MAITLQFEDESHSELRSVLYSVAEDSNLLFIKIKYDEDLPHESRVIRLTKRTAIRLTKELRKQISFLED